MKFVRGVIGLLNFCVKLYRSPDVLENVLDSFSCFYIETVYLNKLHFLWRLTAQFSGVQWENVKKSRSRAHPRRKISKLKEISYNSNPFVKYSTVTQNCKVER